ncbi:MAG: HDOD domain-containing protein [Leptospiraceae bacterium]|nr:HDOD domain-containing protein [Leptospiraceae bacterium]MCP5485930.1 HDOD domain-containing protein [Spirochaetales bacterium]
MTGTDLLKQKGVALLASEKRLSYSFTAFSAPYADLTYHFVSHVLAAHRLSFLENVIMTLLRECVANAVKANLKRAYFDRHAADITSASEYEQLIQDFKQNGVANLEDHIPAMNDLGLKVKVHLETNEHGLRLIIQNNAGMTPEELQRAKERVSVAGRLESVVDAFDEFADEEEGAGLGLILNMLLLKKSGIDPKNFQIASDQANTRVSLTIPRISAVPETVREMYERISAEVQEIPTFPESINRILELCKNTDSSAAMIATQIERDPSVAAGIVRMANSGGFSMGHKISSIQRAVATIGIKNVQQLTLAHGSRSILEQHYSVFQGFWNHAERCALYARLITEQLGLRKISDAAYLGGLLHDIGKIVLHSLDPEVIRGINGLNLDRTENSTAVLEEITLGLSHAEVGARLAERWNFSDELTDVIRNHHSAFAAKPEHRTAVSVVHIADAFIRVEEKKVSYVYFDVEAQGQLGIRRTRDLEALHEHVRGRASLAAGA